MAKVFRISVLLAMALFLAQSLGASIADNLVNAEWLQQHLNDPGVLILDASPAQVYAEKHIPGAISVDVYVYGVKDAATAEMEQRFQSWGVSPGKKIVLYDQGGNMTATRIFFALDYYGYPEKDLAILDGGLAKWQELGLAVTKDVAPVAKGSWRIAKMNSALRARLPEVLDATGDPSANALVEGLGPNWHFGEIVAFDRGGHIPNGILLPSADFYNADKTFKSPEEIRRMLDYVGVRPQQRIYTYCGGGVAASVPFFALKFIVKYPSVKLYVDSEMGWLSDERSLPYWTYDAPYLMRDAKWLQWHNNPMIRTYVGADVSIVDVRPPDAFNKGHIAFSLNVPADVFAKSVADPAKLASVLGPAGVDASQEAVVVSGSGITKEAALAFVMLEKLGQKRVSLLTESFDHWTTLGLSLKTEPTAVGPKKGPRDTTIAPTVYPANLRKGIVIADANGANGLYPRVFIASGKDVPSKTQEGKVVHVPYGELLNGDGTPKEAKEIWKILAKAGVPRYAELVCISNDPGEAAANYVVLKLMGFPDVKVLVL